MSISIGAAGLPPGAKQVNVLAREFPNRFGVGGSEFALPGERVGSGGGAARGGAGGFASAGIDDLKGSRHIAGASDEFAQTDDTQRPPHGGGRRQQDKLPASG